MNLIEKLGYECSKELWGNSERDDPPGDLAKNAYLAGFRKAREMAAGEARNYPSDIAEPYGFCTVCGGGPEVAKFIEKLGEEEV